MSYPAGIPEFAYRLLFVFVPSFVLSVARLECIEAMKSLLRLVVTLMLLTPAASAVAGDLDGSRAAVNKVHRVARREEYTFLRTTAQVREFVKKAKLERVNSSR